MTKTVRAVLGVGLAGSMVLALGGCVRASHQLQTVETQQVVWTQSQPVVIQPQPQVVVQRPVVVRRQVVVQRPVVYRSSGPLTPVRVSVPSQVASYRHCSPGTVRQCDAYCGYGYQTCNSDGYSWGPCIESMY